MGKLVINSYDEFAAHLGEELGASEWLQVDQDRINLFADATLDHQWIHVDVERAKEETDYRGEQHQDAGKLRHERYALRAARNYRFTCALSDQAAQHPEPAWHLQS